MSATFRHSHVFWPVLWAEIKLCQVIITSPFLRCLQTAMVLAEYFDADVLVDNELGEVMNTVAGQFWHVFLKDIGGYGGKTSPGSSLNFACFFFICVLFFWYNKYIYIHIIMCFLVARSFMFILMTRWKVNIVGLCVHNVLDLFLVPRWNHRNQQAKALISAEPVTTS